MSDAAPERFVITYDVTADDYARYAASVERRRSSWTNVNIFVATFFCAIPVALWFHALAAQSLDDSEAIEIAGRFSLYAFALGVIATIIAGYIIRHIERKKYYKTAVAGGRRTAVIDRSGIAVSADGSQWKAPWAAFQRCTRERGLLLVWHSAWSAVSIPLPSFESKDACDKAFAFIGARLAEARATTPSPPPLPVGEPA